MNYSLRIAAIAVSCLVSASCNTINGMGNDIKTFGNGVANSAQGKSWYDEKKKQSPQQAANAQQMQPQQVPQTKIPQ